MGDYSVDKELAVQIRVSIPSSYVKSDKYARYLESWDMINITTTYNFRENPYSATKSSKEIKWVWTQQQIMALHNPSSGYHNTQGMERKYRCSQVMVQ